MRRADEKPRAPRVSAPDLPWDLEEATNDDDERLAQRLPLWSAGLAHSSIEQCVLHGAADGADLTGTTLLDVEIAGPQTPSLTMRGAGLRRVRIIGGRIGTLDLTEARISELEIRDAHIDYLSSAEPARRTS